MKQTMVQMIAGRDHLEERPKNVLQGEVGGFHTVVCPIFRRPEAGRLSWMPGKERFRRRCLPRNF